MTYGTSYKVGDVVEILFYILLICLVITGILLILSIYVQKSLEREKVDREYADKRDRFRKKWGPVYDFSRNAFWWVAAFYVIYLIWN
jgi:uncharacterized membrane protein